jgi:hypothetical protein
MMVLRLLLGAAMGARLVRKVLITAQEEVLAHLRYANSTFLKKKKKNLSLLLLFFQMMMKKKKTTLKSRIAQSKQETFACLDFGHG